MILDQLTLTRFRSYDKQTFSFSPKTTLIVGGNTAGKTNILEAIYFMATGKSFRADSDREVIQWDNEISRIKAIIGETKLEIMVTGGMVAGVKAPLKKYIVNGIARRMIDFVGNLRAVLFCPQDLELVTYSPSIRRRYLDSVLVQIDREYRRNLVSYERGLRQRNRLLDLISDGKAHPHQLLFWNQLLTRAGSYITDARGAYIDFINSCTFTHMQMNQLTYDKSVISQSRLEQYKNEEIGARATLVGPHRDDIIFKKCQMPNAKCQTENDYIDMNKYGSRGEQRLAVLWLKLAEVSFIEEKTGERPLLLLDDIFSELDESHREFVFDIIGKQQTIITSAEEDVVLMLKRKNKTIAIISL